MISYIIDLVKSPDMESNLEEISDYSLTLESKKEDLDIFRKNNTLFDISNIGNNSEVSDWLQSEVIDLKIELNKVELEEIRIDYLHYTTFKTYEIAFVIEEAHTDK